MATTCCICLDTTRNKVCTTCNCYAHPSCWGKFLKKYTKRVTLVSDDTVYLVSSLHVKCPQCRQKIKSLKPLTRSDTLHSRVTWFNTVVSNHVEMLNISDTMQEKEYIHKIIVKFIVRNKHLLKSRDSLDKMVKKYLRCLYVCSRSLANLEYYYIYGKQLDKRIR